MNATQDTTITRGESLTIGHVQYYTSGRKPTATPITVNGEHFLEIGDKVYTECGWCDYGTKHQHSGVYGGVCFQCSGRGYGREVGTVEAAAKIARKRQTDRARRERKAAEEAAKKAAAGVEWRAANSDLADMLDAIFAELAEAHDRMSLMTATQVDVDRLRAVEDTWGDFVLGMANQVGIGRPLTAKQTAAVEQAIEAAFTQQAEERAKQDASRWVGAEGEKLTGVTGVAIVVTRVENEFSPRGASNAFVIVEGTGEWAGATFKIVGAAESLYDVEQGDTVTLNGKVKTKGYGHTEREGVKQTALNYVKVTARVPSGQ